MKRKHVIPIIASLLVAGMLTGCSARGDAGSGSNSDAGIGSSAENSTGSGSSSESGSGVAPTVPDTDDGKYIALTFDDGPTGNEDGLTERLLDGLQERGVHATFFLCGYRIKDFNSMMERFAAEGHEVGNHTMDHIRLDIETEDGGYQQVSSNNTRIEQYTGEKPVLIRPVGGAYNDNVINTMKELHMPIILWNLDTLDWKDHNDSDAIRKRIVENAQNGTIVLEHDLYEATVEGVLLAIDELQAQGYQFVTVSELAQHCGVTLEPGKVYSGFTPEDTIITSGANYS